MFYEQVFLAYEHVFSIYEHAFVAYEYVFVTYERAFVVYENAFVMYEHAFVAYEHIFFAYEHALVAYEHAFSAYKHVGSAYVLVLVPLATENLRCASSMRPQTCRVWPQSWRRWPRGVARGAGQQLFRPINSPQPAPPMKHLLFALLLTGPAALAQAVDSAQAPGFPPKSDFKFSVITEGGFSLGLTSTPNMQAFFKQNNIERDSRVDPFAHLYVGGRYRRLKLMLQLGYGLNYYVPNEKDPRVVRRTYAAYTGGMLGFDVLNNRNRRLYLNLGAGSLNYDYAVINRTNQPVTLQNLPQYAQAGNIPSLELQNAYWDINLELTQREKRKSSAGSVVRLGYRRGWQTSAWKSSVFQLLDAPQDRISQGYLEIGFYLSRNHAGTGKR